MDRVLAWLPFAAVLAFGVYLNRDTLASFAADVILVGLLCVAFQFGRGRYY